MEEEIKKSFWKTKWLWAVGALVIFLVLVLWWTGWLAFGASKYQAVFLTNDQVYFGKLSSPKSDYPVLRDVFYLQVTQTLQPQDPKIPPPAGGQQIQLVKLGNELHGPIDEMKINKDHILFIEDLKPDSQVVKAIEAFKTSQK